MSNVERTFAAEEHSQVLASGGYIKLSEIADAGATNGQTLVYNTSTSSWEPGSGATASLTDAHILVGNGSNIATDVAVSGDLTLANTGAFTIASGAVTTAKIKDGNVTLAKLSTGIAPSHVIKYGGKVTSVGGAASEVFTVAGVVASDLLFVQLQNDGTNNVTVLSAIAGTGNFTVVFSANPGNDAILSYQVIRAAV